MRELMNKLGRQQIPFLFILDYDLKKPFIIPINELDDSILFSFPNKPSLKIIPQMANEKIFFEKFPIALDTYAQAFSKVVDQQKKGNSYLANLTFPTPIKTNLSLKDIFLKSNAPYKLLFKDEFTVFSPESFVKIRDGIISSYPMKGTIEADESNAKEKILNNFKEAAEHATIVDLIRNDLSKVAKKVAVTRYRYLDLVDSFDKRLYQVSSEITGELANNFSANIGDIIYSLLPAGSISGAPKAKTMEIIREAEIDSRGYYSGVFGVFDGVNLNSAVMIRFIEKKEGQMIYRSGGGITANSNLAKEYQEMIDKIYLPFVNEQVPNEVE